VPGNGKSLNFNYALRQIYGERAVDNNCGHGVASVGWKTVPDTEFVAGLDADMAPSPTFFTELVSRLRTPRDAFSQSAQAFWNYDPEADVTDNAQLVKYEVCDSQVRAFGGVRCNGSGWVCRARAMAHAGWWRVDTTGEDQAMGIALERRGYRGYYTMKTLQVSENDIFSFFSFLPAGGVAGEKKLTLSTSLPLFPRLFLKTLQTKTRPDRRSPVHDRGYVRPEDPLRPELLEKRLRPQRHHLGQLALVPQAADGPGPPPRLAHAGLRTRVRPGPRARAAGSLVRVVASQDRRVEPAAALGVARPVPPAAGSRALQRRRRRARA